MAGNSRNISVTAAGGSEGSNGTRPRRVTVRAKARRYKHFDDPLSKERIQEFDFTPADVASRSFFPLLGYGKVRRKVDFSVFPPVVKLKERDIRYPSHMDAAIYGKYSAILNEAYETTLYKSDFGNSILAYRAGIGYNVPFAKSLFDEIKDREHCSVVCMDVSGFFDNLRHDQLKRALKAVLGVERLSEDWYKIYRRLTGFEFVLRDDIVSTIGRSRGRRICSAETFRAAIRPLIQRNAQGYGIPQGTPLSGLLANVYMVGFDQAAHQYLSAVGGSYRRYSDDIAIVLPSRSEVEPALDFVRSGLASLGLALNEEKTTTTTFTVGQDGNLRGEGALLQYLGFTFDGRHALIRAESIKNFYAKMKANIRRYVRAAAKKNIPLDGLRKRVLIGRFTHWGDDRNFVQYAYRAAKELDSPGIRRQLRNHVRIFDEQWAKAVSKYG